MKTGELFGMWKVYLSYLFTNPFLFGVLVLFLIISLSFFILFRRTDSIKAKTLYLYGHIFFLFSPFVLPLFLWKCLMAVLTCPVMVIIYGSIGGFLLTVLASFIIVPYVYPWATKSTRIKNHTINTLVQKWTERVGITRPDLHVLHEATPRAYSITNIKPAIFLSVGILELLNTEELEAVVLHELYHIQNKSSFWMFSLNMVRTFSPLSSFSSIRRSIQNEEQEADHFAVQMQGTDAFLNSAKRKIEQFHTETA